MWARRNAGNSRPQLTPRVTYDPSFRDGACSVIVIRYEISKGANNGQRAKKDYWVLNFLILLSTWLRNTVSTMNYLKSRRSENLRLRVNGCYLEQVMDYGHCWGLQYFAKRNETKWYFAKRYFAKWYFVKWYFAKWYFAKRYFAKRLHKRQCA